MQNQGAVQYSFKQNTTGTEFYENFSPRRFVANSFDCVAFVGQIQLFQTAALSPVTLIQPA